MMMDHLVEILHDLFVRLLHELPLMRPLLPTYVHLIVSAVFPIYTAAHASLVRPTSAAPAKRTKKGSTSDNDEASDDDDDEVEIEETSPKIETLTPSDALLFPVMAGCTLAGLYFVLKFFQDPAWLNWFLGLYFACIGFFFMMRFLKDGFSILRSTLFPRQYSFQGRVWVASNEQQRFTHRGSSETDTHETSPCPGLFRRVPLPSRLETVLWKLRRLLYTKARLEFSIHNLLSLQVPVEALDLVSFSLTTLIIGYHTFIDKPWYLTNLLGFSFCYGSLQFITPGTSWTGTLLLAALFFYDIYFVFFTPMMVTVATKLDVPIKLLFPRPDGCVFPSGAEEGSEVMEEYLRCVAKKRTMAMLGLGDIVIPGMMLAFALRFDLYLFYLRKPKTEDSDQKADKNEDKSSKPTYSPATGAWGERFWVGRKHHAQLFGGKQFPRPYFYATVVGYIIGMLTTVLVMQIANHAQPALLYLVPGVLISLWGMALFKGEIKTLWNYSEIPAEEEAGESKTLESSKNAADKIESSENTTSKIVNNDDDDNKPKEIENPPKKSNAESDHSPKTIGPENHLIYLAIILPKKKKRKDIKSSDDRQSLENEVRSS